MTESGAIIADHFDLDEAPKIKARFNIAPSQAILAIRNGPSGPREPIEANWLTWGLVPSWAKDPSIAYKTINARAETAREKPTFRNAYRYRRCIIPATGYFEWKVDHNNQKIPHYITPERGGFFAFAGLWEHWADPGGSEIESATILTTTAENHAQLSTIHHRMPVILDRKDYRIWMAEEPPGPEIYSRITRTCTDLDFKSWTVSQAVNSARVDDPLLLKPVEYYTQGELF
ncbi:MAG: SOS response-associated peptidase [Opitutales bacterium]|nr:SOS response-associated peptidase [Opitutales bacterium]